MKLKTEIISTVMFCIVSVWKSPVLNTSHVVH